MNRRFTTTIGIAAVALTLSACGADEPDSSSGGAPADTQTEDAGGGIDEGEFRNGEVPGSDPDDAWEKDLPAEPGNETPMGEQVEFELTSAAAEYAHQYDKKSKVDCPDIDGGKDKKVTCEMTYFGQSLEWDVSISGGSMVASYEYESDHRVMSREYLEHALRFEAKSPDVMCELDEEYPLVKPEGVEPVVCHSLKDGKQTKWKVSVGTSGATTFSER